MRLCQCQRRDATLRSKGILTAEAHAQVSTPPEQVGQRSTASNVAAQPGDIRHSTLLANICQASLVRVLERTDLLRPPQLSLTLPDLLEDLVPLLLALSFRLRDRELLQLLLDSLGLGHGVEQTGEESTLLAGHLSRRGIVGDGAVTHGPDVLGSVHHEVLVDGQTTTGVLLGRDLVHQVTDDRADGVTSGPDKKTVRNSLNLLRPIWLGDFGLDVLIGDLLDHGLCADRNLLFLERRLGVVDQLLGEHGKNLRGI